MPATAPNDPGDAEEIARLRARADRLQAESARLYDELWVNAFDMSHVLAEWQFQSLQCPRSDDVDARLYGKFSNELATIAYRLARCSGHWPTLADVLETFGHDYRFTTSASGQLLADELERPTTMLFLVDDYMRGSGDWHVMVMPEHIDHVHELFTHWEMMEEQLEAGHRRWVQGDPDPFGTVEDLAYRQGQQ